jgi:hypothetical protein
MRAFIAVFFFSSVVFAACMAYPGVSWGMMQAPADRSTYQYPETPSPIVSPDPSLSRPIGSGGIAACGNTFSMRVALDMISAPVNLYLAISTPISGAPIYLINSDLDLRPLSEGLVAWKTSTTGPIDAAIFSSIPSSVFPAGIYNLYLLASRPENLDLFYLWITRFEVTPPVSSSGPVTGNIGPSGGVVQTPDHQATLEIPKGALSSSTSITIQPFSDSTDPNFVPGTGWRILPDGLEFDRPVRLTLCYDPGNLPSETDGRLVLYKRGAEEWTGVAGSEEVAKGNAVAAYLNSFSEYCLRLVPLVPETLWIKEARPSSDTIYSYAQTAAADSIPFPGGYYHNVADPAAGFPFWGEPDSCGFATGGTTLGDYHEFEADASAKSLVAKMKTYTILPQFDLFQLGFDGNTQTKPLAAPSDNKRSSYANVALGLNRADTRLHISNLAGKKFDIVLSWFASGIASPNTEYAYYIFDLFYQAIKCGGGNLSQGYVIPAYSEDHGPIRVADGSRRIRIDRLKTIELTLSPYANANSFSGGEIFIDAPASHASIQGWLKVELLPVVRRR